MADAEPSGERREGNQAEGEVEGRLSLLFSTLKKEGKT